jgi:hypothetical protein
VISAKCSWVTVSGGERATAVPSARTRLPCPRAALANS